MSGRQQGHTDARAHSVHDLTVRNQEEKKHYDSKYLNNVFDENNYVGIRAIVDKDKIPIFWSENSIFGFNTNESPCG